jgi:myo-inositol-1(or 4)-monophosphatase
MTKDLASFVTFAQELASAARQETLTRWRGAGSARDKAGDGSFNPVTEADLGSERAMRSLIEARFPEHGIIGEELEDRPASGRWSWSLDPLDGTRAFVCGMPTWVTLIALLEDGAPVLGVIDAPRIDECYVGCEGHAAVHDRDGDHALKTSDCTRLSEARLSTTDPYLFAGTEADAFERVRRSVRTTRYGHDGYAYARLAAGSIDLVVESGLKPWDYLALVPVVRGAGGIVGNWSGGGDLAAGQIVAAATRELFEEAIGLLT